MAGPTQTYPPEFKLPAVPLISDPRRSGAEGARRLGVSQSRLPEWTKAVRAQGADAVPGSGPPTPAEEDLRRRRAAGKRWERERDLRKKATAFFAPRSKGSSAGSRTAAPSPRSSCWAA